MEASELQLLAEDMYSAADAQQEQQEQQERQEESADLENCRMQQGREDGANSRPDMMITLLVC